MKRLEYTRRVRTSFGRAKNPTDAMMVLAHFARERHRLQQERRALEKRIEHIETRLSEIAGTETRLVPVAQLGLLGAGRALPASANASAGCVADAALLTRGW